MHQKVLFVISDHYVTSLCGTKITLGMLTPMSLVLGFDLWKLQLDIPNNFPVILEAFIVVSVMSLLAMKSCYTLQV